MQSICEMTHVFLIKSVYVMLVLFAYASSKGLDEPTHMRSIARAFVARRHKVTGITTYVIALMLQTHRSAPSLVYKVRFSLRKIIQISVCKKLSSAGGA